MSKLNTQYEKQIKKNNVDMFLSKYVHNIVYTGCSYCLI